MLNGCGLEKLLHGHVTLSIQAWSTVNPNMIGTSGKSVKPAVFIESGISGAAHFIVGMTKSKLIINVNKDENAKIFNQSDYGVVGDAAKFMSALNELL